MKINFGSYTYFDGNPSDGIYQGTKGVGETGQFAFDKEKFNSLIANRQYNDAADYASQFHFSDPATQRAHENDIINLRRNGRVLGAIYGQVQNPEDLAKIVFADKVFTDGGLESSTFGSSDGDGDIYKASLRSYYDQLEQYKARIGSKINYSVFGHEIEQEASTLEVTFQPQKQTFLGVDWLAKDNDNNIDNFCAISGLSKKQLADAGVQIINKDDKTTLKFDKSNPLANKILYYTNTKAGRNRVGDVPVLAPGGDRPAIVRGYDKNGNELGFGEGLDAFKQLIDDARNTKENYFKEKNLEFKDYSSTVGPLISDELSSLRSMLNRGDINETQYNQQAKALAPHIFSAINTLGSANYEMYTNNFNDSATDETLIPADNEQRAELANLISSYAPKDIDVSAMVSNGKIGALITLQGSGNETEGDKNDGRRIQIFVPGLLQDEAQEKINRNTSTRAIQELNSMIDWGYDYKLRDGAIISVDDVGHFKKGDEVIDKATAIQELNKDMIMEEGIANLKYQYLNSDNQIVDNAAYEQMARLFSMNAAQDVYGDIQLNINPQTLGVTLTDKFGNVYNPDDIFNRNIDKNKTQYEVYERLNDIYAMYNELMNALDYYN
jgi:hypothetical protein